MAKIYGGTVGEPAPHGFRLNANPAHFVRYDENPLLRYQKRRDTTSGVLKYELSTLQRGIGVFAKAKIPTPCAWQASLPIFGWGMRTPRTLCAVMRILYYVIKKEETPLRVSLLFWQRNRDSNPNIQSQSLLCYRYTIPLSLFSLISIAQRFSFVKGVLKIYFAFF